MLNKHMLGALLMLALLGLIVYSTLLIGVTSYSKFGIWRNASSITKSEL